MIIRRIGWKWWIGIGLVCLLLIYKLVSSFWKNGDLEVTRQATVTRGDLTVKITTTGEVEPQNRVEIKPPIEGRIEEVLVEEGDTVRRGKVLAWMSSTERAALMDAARAQGPDALERWEKAYKPAPLIAPLDGTIIVRAVEPGQTVTSADPVIVLSDRLIVNAQVDETDIGKVRLGQKAIVTLDAYPNVRVEAKVDHKSYESKIVNNVTIYEVDILPEEVPEVFRSGMSANVDIVEEERENALLVPVGAVKRDRKGAFVYLSQGNDGETVKRRVKAGISDDKNTEIISGLQPEDKIVVKTQKYAPSKKKNSGRSPFMPSRRRGRSRR